MRRFGVVAILGAALMAGCMPIGREFARPTTTSLTPGVSSIADVTKAIGEPTNQVAWSRNDNVFRQAPQGASLPTPFPAAPVGGTVKRLYYYYSFKLGEPVRPGVEPARSFYAWFWNDKLVAFTGTSSFKTDATGFDDTKVDTVKAWKSLRADVIAAFGPPNGIAVYPATSAEDQEVLIYRGFEWDTSRNQYESKSLFVAVNALGIVEDVRFSGATNPIPPPAPTGGGVPIQIYTPPRPRGK